MQSFYLKKIGIYYILEGTSFATFQTEDETFGWQFNNIAETYFYKNFKEAQLAKKFEEHWSRFDN